MRETFYYQTYAKLFEPSVYHTEFRNSMMEALATTGERLDKVGCTESHNYHKCLIEYRKLSTLIVSGSIAKGLFYIYVQLRFIPCKANSHYRSWSYQKKKNQKKY